MIIELTRITTPEEMGPSASCGICGEGFEQGVVYAFALTDRRTEIGVVCPTCMEHLGRHPSGRFPTVEEYRRLEAQWGTPAYASGEEADRAEGQLD
jgi:hypothetical protein